jgi:hypothetical protein
MKTIGRLLIAVGLLITVLSPKIVFPGLERLIGIEAIVGKENVSYNNDKTYMFTNPGAMMRWTMAVAACGITVCAAGLVLVLKNRKNNGANNRLQSTSHYVRRA